MGSTVTLAFLHHAAAFLIVGVLTAELVLLRGEITIPTARTLIRIDAAYGIAATVLLIVGFLRVFYTEKGAAYYFHSGSFLAKLALFLIVALLSIYPTVQFLKMRKPLARGEVPVLETSVRSRLRMLVHIELTLLFVIMLCAVMMARGLWFLG